LPAFVLFLSPDWLFFVICNFESLPEINSLFYYCNPLKNKDFFLETNISIN
jgi:hypothetical protein